MKRSFIRRALYEPGTRPFVIVNDILALLTLVSVFSLILETVPRLAAYAPYFTAIEYIAVFFFTLEYLARIAVNRKQVSSYVFSFFGIIDLLAIIPTYLGFSNLTFLKTTRILRILRLLRMIRLAKIARFGSEKRRDLEEYGDIYRLNVGIYFFALFSSIILFGTLIYIVEGTNPTFSSIPSAMLWALKPLLGGVAQIEPVTVLGQIVAVLARFTGLILFGLLIAVIGNSVKRLMFGSKKIET
ncbi:ion transporter [Candidatus Kaiserbacteria bacterium]|nr:ion transporter [Candidatus Kaiserbacteria bacterium]